MADKERQMNAEVWSKLPEDVLRSVLARLPWWKALEFRGVCKSWHKLLSNPNFLAKSFPLSTTRPPCIILSTADESAIVNFAVRRWNVLPRSSLLPGFRAADCFEIWAATSGLLLMEGRQGSRFLVNPLNKTRRRLPPVPPLEGQISGSHHSLKMMANGQTNNIKIVYVRGVQTVADFMLSDAELWNIYVYDLVKNSWDLVSKNLHRAGPNSLENAVFVGDDLYLLTKKMGGWRPWRHTHSVLRATASDLVEIPSGFTADFPNIYMFEHRGRLMLVRGSEERNPCVDIWVLADMRWEKVVSMPERFLRKFYGKLQNDMINFDSEGDFVCFSFYFNMDVIIVYNLMDQVWWEISCKDYISQDFDFHETFVWQPNLNIVL